MNKKIIAVICASLLIVSVVLTSCGKKPTVKAGGEEYPIVTDKEGNTLVDKDGDLYIYVTDANGKKVKTDSGEDETAIVTFPDKLADGQLYETKDFKMIYPKGWTVGASGLATSKDYPGVTIMIQNIGAAAEGETLDSITDGSLAEIQSINENMANEYPGATVERTTVTLEKCQTEARVIKWQVPDPANQSITMAYQETITFIYDGYKYHIQYLLEEGATFNPELNMVSMFSENLIMK